MSKWYYLVIDDIQNIADCVQYFESELASAKFEVGMKGKTIETHTAELPGIVENRYSQLQEIEAILEHLNILLRKERSRSFKKFLEHYQRVLSSADCIKYVDGDDEVINMSILVNEFALLRNKYLAIHKGLESKGWMLSHITKLKCAGLDDATI